MLLDDVRLPPPPPWRRFVNPRVVRIRVLLESRAGFPALNMESPVNENENNV